MGLTRQANIIITGTPGTGKSSHAQLLVEQVPELNLIDVNVLAKEQNLYDGYDEERDARIVDHEKLLDAIEDDLEKGNQVIDWHVADIFPENDIDLVVVLRTDNTTLYDRLKEREYDEKKIGENIDAEIMEVILNDVRENYEEDVIVELDSNTIEQVQANVDRIAEWYANWKQENPSGVRNIDLNEDENDSDESDDEQARDEATQEAKDLQDEAK